MKSPDDNTIMLVKLNPEGAPFYFIGYKGKQLLGESSLGLKLEDADFTKGLKIELVSDVKTIHDQYSFISGKMKNCVYKKHGMWQVLTGKLPRRRYFLSCLLLLKI